MPDCSSLFLATFAVNFADYSTQVYTAYTTSAFKQHSAMSAARVVMNITRIASYPIIAKLGDVRKLCTSSISMLTTIPGLWPS